jgi:hypothetical protein
MSNTNTSKKEFRVGDRILYNNGEYHGVVIDVLNDKTLVTKWDDAPWTSTNTDHIDYITHDTYIRVGDRIRVTGTKYYTEYIGEYGVVEEINQNYQPYPYHVRYDGYDGTLILWSTGIKVSNDTPLTKDKMKGKEDKAVDNEQVTRDGYVYTKLKDLSPASVLKGNPCKGEFAEYVETAVYDGLSFYDDIDLKSVLDYDAEHPYWLPWLISHGYIGKEEVRKEKVRKVEVYENVKWNKYGGFVSMGEARRSWMERPPMKVTLEWEE